MKRIQLFLLLWVFLVSSMGQTRVTFVLNLDPLISRQEFIPGAESRVLVRGDFNQWEGSTHELQDTGGNVYQGSFDLEGAPGDTLEYKFVIEKEPGRLFWESDPNPSNPNHGNRILVLEEEAMKLPEAFYRPGAYFTYPVVFSQEELQEDFSSFRSILEETHPALYDYTDKQVLDSLFDRNYARIDGPLDFSSFLLLMTEVISQVGCGHSSMWIPGGFWNAAPDGLFPLKMYIREGRGTVIGSYAEAESGSRDEQMLPLGSEVLSINGKPLKDIANRLEGLTSADGLNQAFRTAKVNQYFPLKYAVAYGLSDSFRVRAELPGQQGIVERTLQPVSKPQVDKSRPGDPELSFREVEPGKVGLLTINSFGYYGRVDWFKSFMDSVFLVCRDSQIESLILDLRGNGGGDPFCASYLWGYLQHEPSPYFEDHYGRYDTLANPVPMPDNYFKGRLYTLIDGLGFSTTGHFCGLLKYHGVGEFVGSETGATYTCTGNATYPALDHTGIMVGTARVMRYTAAVKDMDPTRGIPPDHPVKISPQDLIEGRDVVLEKALSLARNP